MRIAFDPGVTTGYAMCEDNGVLIDYGQLKKEELFGFLTTTCPTRIIVENFKIRPNVNFSWNEMEVLRVIGAIEYWAFLANSFVVFQEPAMKSVGYKWAGISVPKNHDMSHGTDAYAHLVYYNTKVLGLPIPALKRMKEEHVKGND